MANRGVSKGQIYWQRSHRGTAPVNVLVICAIVHLCAISRGSTIPSNTPQSDIHQVHREGGVRIENRCGTWPHKYAHLHRSIRSGAQSPRYVINSPRGGLADELSCMGSAFYLAVLTNRAFLINEVDASAMFSSAYTSPFIDWQYRADEVSGLTTYEIASFSTGGSELAGGNFDVFRWGNLSSIGAEEEVLRVDNCNAGLVVQLFENPNYKARLFEMGLRPETAYGCMFQYLFKISPETESMFPREAALMLDDSILKIGVQIRTGDDALQHPNDGEPSIEEAQAELLPYQEHFACATHLEDVAKSSNKGKKVIWFVISDSIFLRKSAVLVYGSKVLTNTENNNTLKHVIKELGGGGAAIMKHTAGEHWLYSLSDYFVFGSGGFGRSSALSSLKWGFYNVRMGCKPLGVQELHMLLPGIK